ncbi:unnamed protein product [Larinioides sclopetarius]|uniref:Uncharacterized protein n=1 Tax=Larinioides sclopetarius TaxID=280406 RepID=A0AAV1YWS2_9ARAC
MASDGQQYENFAEDQQYSEYNEQNYTEAMDEGGESGGQMQNVNGSSNGQSSTKAPSDDDRTETSYNSVGIVWSRPMSLAKQVMVVIDTTVRWTKCEGFPFVSPTWMSAPHHNGNCSLVVSVGIQIKRI